MLGFVFLYASLYYQGQAVKWDVSTFSGNSLTSVEGYCIILIMYECLESKLYLKK